MGRGLDGYLISVHWHCVVLRVRGGGGSPPVCGGYSEGETPLPIPNRAVKPLSADGTWLARAWESRTPPVLFRRWGRLRAAPRRLPSQARARAAVLERGDSAAPGSECERECWPRMSSRRHTQGSLDGRATAFAVLLAGVAAMALASAPAQA